MPIKITRLIHFDPDQLDELDDLSYKMKVPRAAIIRKAIKLHLLKIKNKK